MFTVATHNGSFHADELTACVILSLLYEDIKIIRSRNLETLEQGDIVIDVSGQFDLKNTLTIILKNLPKPVLIILNMLQQD